MYKLSQGKRFNKFLSNPKFLTSNVTEAILCIKKVKKEASLKIQLKVLIFKKNYSVASSQQKLYLTCLLVSLWVTPI